MQQGIVLFDFCNNLGYILGENITTLLINKEIIFSFPCRKTPLKLHPTDNCSRFGKLFQFNNKRFYIDLLKTCLNAKLL